ARCERDAGVARGRDTLVLLADAADLRELRDYLGCAVGGAVVDDDHLVRLVVLCEGAAQRLGEEALPVVDGDDGGERRMAAAHFTIVVQISLVLAAGIVTAT